MVETFLHRAALLRPHASHGARGLIGVGLGVTPEHVEYKAMREEFLAGYAGAICERTILFPGVKSEIEES